MKYILEINVCTDGDFCLPFVPRGMKYDDDGDYTFKKAYKNRNTAIEDVLNICSFLKGQIDTDRDYIEKYWVQCIDSFEEAVRNVEEELGV